MPKKIDYSSLYTLRKDGRYQASYTDDNGDRHFKYNRDPEKLYNEMQAVGQPKDPTFAEIAEAWHDYAWERIANGTKGSYESAYKRAIEAAKELNAVEVTAPLISKQLEQMKRKDYGLKTVKTQRTVYSLIFQYAINDETYGKFVTSNPAKNVILPKHLKAEKREAPEDDIISKIRSNATTAYWGLFAMFLISTGCRRGEALAVTWGDIDTENKTITINKAIKYAGGSAKLGDTKTEYSVRPVPLLPDLEQLLVKPEKAKDTDYVFQSASGTYIVESTYRRKWKHYCTDMGFMECVLEEERTSKQGHKYVHREYKSTLTAHVLRHGYATMLFEAGVDVYTAQKLLGHADIKTTMAIYTHLRERKQKESLDKLTAYVNSNYAV